MAYFTDVNVAIYFCQMYRAFFYILMIIYNLHIDVDFTKIIYLPFGINL